MLENSLENLVSPAQDYIVANEKRFIYQITRKNVCIYLSHDDAEHDDLLQTLRVNNFTINKPAQSSYEIAYHALGDLIQALIILSRYGYRIAWKELTQYTNTTNTFIYPTEQHEV